MKIENLDNHPEWKSRIAAWLHVEFAQVDARYGSVASTQETLSHPDRYLTVVAVVDGAPVGCASFVRSDLPISPLEGWLADLYVDAPHRCRGIGSALIHACVEFAAKTRGQIYLFTEHEQEFYARRGWRAVPGTPTEYLGQPITVMACSL